MSFNRLRSLPMLAVGCIILGGCTSEPSSTGSALRSDSSSSSSSLPSSTTTDTASTPKQKPSYEEMLATIDGSGTDEIKVNRFRSLLSQLGETYVENKKQISDMTVRGKEMLEKEGVSESLLNIMEGLNKIFSVKIKNQKYAEYIAAYVTLRKKGQSHQEAIEGLRDLIAAITSKK